ncbi:MAG: redoxin domain-containing protein [Acidobacteria bacterium]|nr:redoxin domain-containing protein [Acidobacteriota bacterium]
MRSLQASLEKFTARGVRIVAVSVDPVDVTRKHSEKQGFTFTFLSDTKAEVIRRYDLLHAGGFGGADISRPAEFLLDADGKVLWLNLTESYNVRAKAEEILKVMDGLVARSPAKP